MGNEEKNIEVEYGGDEEASLFLVKLYKEGVLVKKDMKKSVSYFYNANFKDSAYGLALCYLNGEGVEKNINPAYKWIEDAANANCLEAKNLLLIVIEQALLFKKVLELQIDLKQKLMRTKKILNLKNLYKVIFGG